MQTLHNHEKTIYLLTLRNYLQNLDAARKYDIDVIVSMVYDAKNLMITYKTFLALCLHIPYCMATQTNKGAETMKKETVKKINGWIEETLIQCEVVEKLSTTLIDQLDRTDTNHLAFAANQAINNHLNSVFEVLAHYSDDLIDMATTDMNMVRVAVKR